MGYLGCRKFVFFQVFLVVFAVPTCRGLTDVRDVYAISSLYAALGNPPLAGWLPVGGDPCGLAWQGVQCVNANITAIILNGLNLGGELSADLGSFPSIMQIDLGNNHIGGSIPTILPATIRILSLSNNQLSGNILDGISLLGQLTDMLLDNNHLTGVIPDAFQQLTGLTTLNLSGNMLSGQLPSSMGNLSSLTKLYLQDNQLSGMLDVLEDLPLIDLNIENNLFSGPVPDKLNSVPNFRKDGNPFNTSILPSPPVSSPSPSPSSSKAYPPELPPVQQSTGPTLQQFPQTGSTKGTTKTSKSISWIAIAGVLVIIVLTLGLCLLLSRCCKRRQVAEKTGKQHEAHAYSGPRANYKDDHSLQKPTYQAEKATKESVMRQAMTSVESKQDKDVNNKNAFPKQEGHRIDMTRTDSSVTDSSVMNSSILPPPPPPFPLLPSERIIADPILPLITPSGRTMNSVKKFSIASLQQYTESFSQENLMGRGLLGTVYKAELPNGKLLAVKKLDTAAAGHQSDQEFIELVYNIAKLQHANIIQLVGYCMEHSQRMLVYEYCENGTLYESLHLDDLIHKRLSWNTRIHMALQAARALEYLHEVCQPPVVHQNFKSANILLDNRLSVYVSDSGLAPLLSSNSMAQLQGCGYGGPELELGTYTYHSDVYSFGVVMLELLTGRKSYDRSRPRGEQFLVRWAIPRLHDIDALSRMVDPSLNGAYPSKSLSRFADIISLCIQPEPEFRPPMSEIVQNLLHMVQRDS
ncbi:hypothetical protein ACH5RR_017821 [Cinchona calisaya]|uniref:Protein kinase domain-containing protein n=1 Tax=Cinchona calisaya TaxID=153742 RepID=A0ABD2ZJP4_9GENT